jgi:hypothetical protein
MELDATMTSLAVEPSTRYENFGLLLVMLTASFLVSGVSDARAVTLLAAALNVGSLVVGFASSDISISSPRSIALVLLGASGAVVVGLTPIESLAFALGATAHAAMLGALTYGITARVLRHGQVTTQTILGALAVYLLIGQTFAWIYFALPGFLDQQILEPVNQGNLPIYYSYVVLTTLGFGDIAPASPLAQRLTVLEALVGQVFLAVLVARLVSVYSNDR